ncbi:MAG TPA: excinuclease ABC subunit C [Geobacter sp.]|nr:excinuclease ABC subunit C [Geobacter sp.]
MKYVYFLQSIPHPDQHYVGLTSNLKSRLAAHNAGQSHHTAKYLPWKLVTYLGFADESKASAFEKYLKSGSGRAFRYKHFL